MTETLLTPPITPAEQLPAAMPFAEQVKQLNAEYTAKVPTPEELSQLQEVVGQLTGSHSDEQYQGPNGELVAKKDAEELRRVASDKNWLLNEGQSKDLTKISKAERLSDLPAALRKDVRKHKRDVMEPDYLTLTQVKDEASRRLTLDRAIREANKADAKQHVDALRSERLSLLDNRMTEELGNVRSSTYQKVLKEQMAAAEAELARETAQNPDKLNVHYARQELTAKARKAAQEAADNAVRTRRLYIEDNGGAAAISHIKKEEAAAAEKEAFLKRLHGADYGKGKRTDTAKQSGVPTIAKLERPEGVPYKTWLGLSPDERKRAVAADLVDRDITTTGDPELDAELERLGLWADKAQDADMTPAPITDPTPTGLRSRLNNAFAWGKKQVRKAYESAGTHAGMFHSGQLKAFYSDPEKGESRKRKTVIGAVMGMVAVGAAVYLESRGHSVSHHAAEAQPTSHQVMTGSANAASMHEAVVSAQPDLAASLTLGHHGDTMEGAIRNFLQGNGYPHDESTLTKVTEATLKANHQTWASAHSLHVGYQFGIPRSVLEQLEKTPNKHISAI